MSYAAAIDQLSTMTPELHTQPGQQRRKFSLTEIGALLAALGDPHRRFPSVLIAGTNGKGSTAATLASILKTSGLRTGLYTSPHLVRPNERIRIDGVEISDDAFARLYFQVDDAGRQLVLNRNLAQLPSFFETLTAMAFLYFAEANIDIAVLEVGMGGRLDATNIVDPLLSIVTDISLDHTEWLGPTIAAIAREKAGILRSHGTLITLPQHPEANRVLGEVATELGTRAVSAVPYMPAIAKVGPARTGRGLVGQGLSHDATPGLVSGHDFSRAERAIKKEGASAPEGRLGTFIPEASSYPVQVLGSLIQVDSPLHGEHQHRNIALAIAAAVELATHHNLPITAASIAAGIHSTQWPGRLEVIETLPSSRIGPASANQPCTQRRPVDQEAPQPETCHPENPRAWGPVDNEVVHGVSGSKDLQLNSSCVAGNSSVWRDEGIDPRRSSIQVVLDVAHNPAGAWALRAALRSEFGLDDPAQTPATLIFSCLRDKPLAEMAQILFPLFSEVIFAPIHSPRATPMAELLAAAEAVGIPARAASTIEEALAWAEIAGTSHTGAVGGLSPRNAAPNDAGALAPEVREAPSARPAKIAFPASLEASDSGSHSSGRAARPATRAVVAGSVYLVGEVRPLLLARAAELRGTVIAP